MKATTSGRTVTVTMPAAQAKKLKDELLWCRDDDEQSIRLYEALAALDDDQEDQT